MKNQLVICILLCLVVGACQLQTDAEPPLRELSLTPLSLTAEDSSQVDYEKGVIQVPVNRSSDSEQTWDVEFVRFKRATNASPDTPPIFILRGGPGSDAATELLEDPGYFDYFLAPYLQISDVVIPGQRGFRTSGATPCESMRMLSIEEAMDEEVRLAERDRALSACRSKWEEKGVDLRGFNVEEMAADVFDIARSLGYDNIQLVGQSFGSHWGMVTLRNYPNLIARATLSGLEGPDHTYDMPGHVVAALERIAESAEASPALAPHIPEGGLLAAYQQLIDQANESPIPVKATNPETDQEISFFLDGDDLRSFTRGYTRGTTWRFLMPAWPLDLLTLLNQNYDDAAQSRVYDFLENRLREAAYYQVDCASGISATRGEQLRSDPGANLIGPTWQYYDTNCAPWDADLGDDFRTPFTTDVPAVLIHGNWDTSTPYENALEVRSFFQNHRFIHVEGGSHGAFREAREDVEGFREQVYQWMETGRFDHIPEEVTLPPVQWQPFQE